MVSCGYNDGCIVFRKYIKLFCSELHTEATIHGRFSKYIISQKTYISVMIPLTF